MEDYEKKYKESLGRANAKIETYNHLGNASAVKSICEIFPELKESKDERVRKSIIDLVEKQMPKSENKKWMIAWLEKQDQKKHEEELENAYKCADEVQYRRGYEDAKRELKKQGEKVDVIKNFNTEFERQISHLIASTINKEHEYNEGFVKWAANALLNYAKHELEEQVEHKPQDKPALEVWKDMRLEVYQQASGNRHEPNYSDDSTKMFSLTDIDEIFEKITEKQDKQKSTDKVKQKFKVGDWIVQEGVGTYKVVEVYKWYEVIGIDGNQYSISFLQENDCHLWTIQDAKDGDVLSYVTDEGNLWIMIYRSLYKPYEGHVHYHALLVNDNFIDKGTCCICIDNLKPATKGQRELLFSKMKEAGYEWDAKKKELKKISVQSAWSEEDEKTIDEAISLINMLASGYGEKVTEPITFNGVKMINNIKERLRNLHQKPNHWKPSDRQMKQLGWVAEQNKDNALSKELMTLYQDLKKLREE